MYLLVFLLILSINLIPAFMPPTWIVLAFLYLHFHLAFVPTILIGVAAATTGRTLLALTARFWFARLLPEKFIRNYKDLGSFLEQHEKLTIPVVLGYAFSPISSNSLFIMAGLSRVDLRLIAFSFFVGRLFSYSFWITTSGHIAKTLDTIFAGNFTSTHSVISALFSSATIIVIGKINWKKLLNIKTAESIHKS